MSNSERKTLRHQARPEILVWAKQLGSNPAPGEAALWDRLRASRLGVRFRRQAILRGWIADFWCPAKRLVIEIDGPSHRSRERQAKDRFRDKKLHAEFGIMTLRFPVENVNGSVEDVVNETRAAVLSRPTSYIHFTGSSHRMDSKYVGVT